MISASNKASVITKQLWIFRAIISMENIDNCNLHINLKIKCLFITSKDFLSTWSFFSPERFTSV